MHSLRWRLEYCQLWEGMWATWKVCPNSSSISLSNPAVNYSIYCLTWDLKRSENFSHDLNRLQWDRCWVCTSFFASSRCLCSDLGALTTYQHCGFQLHRTLPLAYILIQFRYDYNREAGAKQGSGLAGSTQRAGSRAAAPVRDLDGAGASYILVASVTGGGSDQSPGPSIRSLEFECFISHPSRVWSSVLHQAPAYRGSDMASLSKCLALLDLGWVLYWLLTLNKHLVFITNGSRPERGAVLGGAVT